MEHVCLGRTGIAVSPLCMGTLTVGPLQAGLSPRAGGEIIAYAIERGINFFDTAQLYGTYPHLRHAMRLTGRYDITVSSKTYAYSRRLAMEAVDEARRALDRDYVDIFMLHEQESIHTLRGHRDALDYLMECREKGIIRAVGASMHHIAAVVGAAKLGLDVIHPLLNLRGLGIADGSRADMEAAVEQAHQAGIGVFSMKPLGGGNLFHAAAESLRYILSLSYIDSIAVGMQSRDEIDANYGFWEAGSFSRESAAALSKKQRYLHIDDWCEGCGRCVARCGQGALSLSGNKAVCDTSRCVLCCYCAAVCPAWAIKVV